jgi:hypothetical protein
MAPDTYPSQQGDLFTCSLRAVLVAKMVTSFTGCRLRERRS